MTKFSATARLQHIAALAALGASVAAFSAPAIAAEKAEGGAKIAAAAATTAVAERSVKKYCVVATRTESRIPKKICKTAEGWRLAGEEIVRR